MSWQIHEEIIVLHVFASQASLLMTFNSEARKVGDLHLVHNSHNTNVHSFASHSLQLKIAKMSHSTSTQEKIAV